MQGIFNNKIFWVTILSWVIAQSIKVILGLVKEKKFNFNWIFKAGGMPSAHSAGVITLALCLGKEAGFSSPLFALASIFALMTMFDAQTWRRSVGVQAKILNRIIEDIQERKKIEEKRIKELMGHTPIEVFVGALIGILVAIIFY